MFPTSDLDITVEVYLGANPTDFPDDWPAPTDLSDRLLRQPIQIRRGRGQNQKTASAGSCTLWLDNTDGALTPFLATSVYYPEWDLGVPIRVSVSGVGTTPPYVRHAGFVADIEAVMVPGTGGKNISAVRVTSAGVLRRISQGAVVKSALRRALLAIEPEQYWPFEDESGSTSAGSALSSGVSLPLNGSSPFGSDGTLAGSSSLANFPATDTPTIEGSFTASGVTAFWAVSVWVLFPDPVVTDTFMRFLEFDVSGSSESYWEFSAYGTITFNPAFQVSSSNGSGFFLDAVSGFPTPNPYDGEWHHVMVTAAQNGVNIDGKLYVDGVLEVSQSIVGIVGAPAAVKINPRSTGTAAAVQCSIGHVSIHSNLDGIIDTVSAGDGYTGEQAHERVERICRQEDIPFSGTAARSVECGPQPIDDLVGVMQDAETVDHGMLVEDFTWGLDYRASSQRENLEPVITVDLSTYRTTAGTQADVLTPVRNDARTRNEWTITREGGSSATASDEVHKAKRGRYNDSATVNVENDSRLLHEAQWRVHEGTFEGLRYQTLPLDLAANLDD